MKTTVRKNLLRYTLFAVAIVFALLLIAPFMQSRKKAYAGSEYENVFVGEVIVAEEYEIAYGDGVVKAESMTVVCPSGGVYGGDKFTMSQAGKYQITYHATVDGEPVEETCYYMAIRMPQNIIKADTEVSFGMYEVESPYTLTKETYGAIVTMRAGEKVSFTTNVKTSRLTADYSIVDLIVMPSVFRETDFERLTIRVSDAENANNYVDIIVISSNMVDGDGQISYVQAGAAGQQPGGYEGSTFHTNSATYGTAVEHSFRAYGHTGDFRSNPTVSENSLTIAIDNEERKVYCGPYTNKDTTKLLVNDLDDSGHYKGNPWGGFTSDEVTVTITADRFVKASGKILVKSFADFDLSENIEDTVAPQINVNYDKNQAMPTAQVGKEFPIFPFVARDALDAQLKTNVFVNYIDAHGQKITVENDGESFFVKYAGTYEIIYCAEDYSGNKTEEVLVINAEEVTPNIYVAIETPLVEADAYQTVSIPMADQMQAFGGSGYLSVERAVYNPKNQEMDIKDELQLTMLGDYKVVYSVTDYLGNTEYGIMTVRSMPLEKPIFIETPAFDSALIKGFTYELPQPFVVETSEGDIQEVVCKTYVNGELVNDSFKADGEEMTIRYVADGKTGKNEWETTLSVVDTENGKYKSKYFYTEGDVEILDEKAYLEFVFDANSSAQFITPLYTQAFGITLAYDKAKTNFSSMYFTLTDAANRNHSITMHFFYNPAEDSWMAQLQNSAGKFSYATSKDILTFALSDDGKKIIDTSGIATATLSNYDNGEPFQGFSNTLYWTLGFEGVQGESSLRVTQVCNQSLGHNKSSIDKAKDEIKPVIILDDEFLMRQKLGSKAQIPTAKAYDVLGQIKEFTITVEKVGGDVIASGPATETLDFTLDQAGYYTVTYFAKDSNGNKESIPYTILVNDETAPVLTVKNNLKSQYKQGDTIKIPTYTATDNGENCYVQVTLILPNNELRMLQYNENGTITSMLSKESDLYESAFKAGDDAFVALYKGRYVLRILAYDEYYNTTVKEIEFIVK